MYVIQISINMGFNHYIAWNLIKYLFKTILGSIDKKLSARLADFGR